MLDNHIIQGLKPVDKPKNMRTEVGCFCSFRPAAKTLAAGVPF